MKKRTRKTPKTWAGSIAEAARRTGLSRTSLTIYRGEGCPAFRPGGRIELNELEVWVAAHGKRAAEDSEAMKAARLRILTASAERMERENRVKRGEMVPLSEIRTGIREAMGVHFTELERIFLSELPPVVAGLDAHGVYTRCFEAIGKLKRTLRETYGRIAREACQ